MHRSLFCLTLALLQSLGAWAAGAEEGLRVEGFGTLAAYRADDAVAGLRAEQRTAHPTRRDWRFDGDSLISTQLTVHPGGPVRGVLQLLAKDDLDQRWQPRVEWLYASWDARPDLNLRLGRVVLPALLLSDTRNLAYAQTSVRPPNTIYQINPVTTLDGLSGYANLADAHLDIEAAAGRGRLRVAIGKIEFDRIAVLALRWHVDGLNLRLSHLGFALDAQAPGFEAAVSSLANSPLCAQCAPLLAERYRFQDVKGHMVSLAAVLERGPLTLQAEAAQRQSNSALVPDTRAWYLQASWRWGRWTPYAVIGALRFRESPLGLQAAAGAPAPAVAAIARYDLYLQSRNDRRIAQLGLRCELRENLALKLQVERLHATRPPFLGVDNIVSSPTLPPIGAYSGPAWDGRMNAVSVNLDFVF